MASLKGRERVVPERKANGLAISLGDLAVDAGLFSEEITQDISFGRLHFMLELLVDREIADEPEDESGVGGPCFTEGE